MEFVWRSNCVKLRVKQQHEGDDCYHSDAGDTMRREHGTTPNGNPIGGRWVLRAPCGAWVDIDANRHDLAERNNFQLDHGETTT